MPAGYFVDTWFFIAFSDPRDSHHRQARRLGAVMDGNQLVTHEGILTELLAYFAEEDTWGRLRAVKTVRNALQEMDVVSPDRDLFRRAVALYEDRSDKHYSLVDCMSMIVMRERGFTHVLTNDHHFRQEGFAVLSDGP